MGAKGNNINIFVALGKYRMGPIERMTGLNDVTKPAIKFKAIDQELLRVQSYKRRIIVGCAMDLGLAVLAWWHFIP